MMLKRMLAARVVAATTFILGLAMLIHSGCGNEQPTEPETAEEKHPVVTATLKEIVDERLSTEIPGWQRQTGQFLAPPRQMQFSKFTTPPSEWIRQFQGEYRLVEHRVAVPRESISISVEGNDPDESYLMRIEPENAQGVPNALTVIYSNYENFSSTRDDIPDGWPMVSYQLLAVNESDKILVLFANNLGARGYFHAEGHADHMEPLMHLVAVGYKWNSLTDTLQLVSHTTWRGADKALWVLKP